MLVSVHLNLIGVCLLTSLRKLRIEDLFPLFELLLQVSVKLFLVCDTLLLLGILLFQLLVDNLHLCKFVSICIELICEFQMGLGVGALLLFLGLLLLFDLLLE